jgi:hypothetical protein
MAIRSKKAQRERDQRIRRWLMWGSVTLLAFFIGIVTALHQPFLRIGEIHIEGNDTVFAEDITAKLHETLDKKKLLIFPRDTIFFYPRSLLKEQLVDHFTRIQDVRMRVRSFDVLDIAITEHEPEYLWCNGDQCYFMDATSYVFARAPYFSDYVYIKFEGSHFDIADAPLREYVLRSEDLSSVFGLYDELARREIFVNKVAVQGFNDYRFSLDTIEGMRVGSQSHIRINLDMSIEQVLDNLRLTFEQENFRTKLIDQPENLHYIDLRFEDKVLFRFASQGEIAAEDLEEENEEEVSEG